MTAFQRALVVLAFVWFAFALGHYHFSHDGLLERDGYFHARYAQMLPERGLARSFPWTQASTWKERFCDKEFLFHVLMVPFTRDQAEPLAGAKGFALLLALAALSVLFEVLRRHGAPWPILFVFLALAMGSPFIQRLTMIRSHVLSLVLLLLGLHFLLRTNWKALLILGFVYGWSYTVPFALAMTAVPFALGRWAGGGGLDWRSPLAAAGGALLGLAIHPYTPLTFETFLTYLDVMRGGAEGRASGLELGFELYAAPFTAFLRLMPLYLATALAAAGLAAWLRRRATPETIGAAAAALFWFATSLFFFRFVEYAVPLLALALGLLVRDTAKALGPEVAAKWRTIGLGFAGLVVVAGHAHGLSGAHRHLARTDPLIYRGAADWMAQNLDEGETVLHLWWEDFPELYYAAPRQRYIWGLDPTYTVRYDADLARLLEETRTHQRPLRPAELARAFDARALIMKHALALQYPELLAPGWEPVYADRYAVVFMLAGPHGPPDELVPARVRKGFVFEPRAVALKEP